MNDGNAGALSRESIRGSDAARLRPALYTQGERTAAGIADWGVGLLKKEVQKRVGGGGGKKGGSGGSGSGGGDSGNTDGKDVVALDPSSFKKQVLGSQDLWMVEFFAPWCGHCKKLAPEWSKAATKVKGKVNFGAVDCTVHESLCGQYGARAWVRVASRKTHAREKHHDRAADVAEFSRPCAPLFPPPPAPRQMSRGSLRSSSLAGTRALRRSTTARALRRRS